MNYVWRYDDLGGEPDFVAADEARRPLDLCMVEALRLVGRLVILEVRAERIHPQ